MSEKVSYYNEEYAPIEDDYLAAQARENLGTVQEPIERRTENTQKRPRSRYDEDMYALPNSDDDDDHSPTVLRSTSTPKPSRKKINWKMVAGVIIVIGVLGLAAGISYMYLVPGENGKCDDIYNLTSMETSNYLEHFA